MKKVGLLLGCVCITMMSFGQTTPIPDSNFEQKLIDLGIDTNGLTGDIINIDAIAIGSLNLNNSGINDLQGIEAFVDLEQLYCSQNNLATLDLSNNTYLTKLNCIENVMTSINISSNLALNELWCGFNFLQDLDVTSNPYLTVLNCEYNELSSLDVSANTALVYLDYSRNWGPNVNLTNNTSLRHLNCGDNALTSIDISNNILLENFIGRSNQLVELDLSHHTALAFVKLYSNKLQSLNIKNANNSSITTFDATSNPDLICIQVDDSTAATAGTGVYVDWQKDNTTTYNVDCQSIQLTYIPDNHFENYLETHDANGNQVAVGAVTSMGNGIAYDNYVLTSNINTVLKLNISAKGVSDLTGIEDFELLEILFSVNNPLTNISLNNNVQLMELHCGGLGWSGITIENLDISTNTKLETLYCGYGNLTSLDVSSNNNLKLLSCVNNEITNLNVSENLELEELKCSGNKLVDFDVSTNVKLSILYCGANNLTSLNVKNGRNDLLFNFNASNNPDLLCIQVDDASDANDQTGDYSNWVKDAIAGYSENCDYTAQLTTYVPDDNFEQRLIDLGYDYGDLDNYVLTSNIDQVEVLYISDRSIADLTGIEDFADLAILDCNGNNLTELNLSTNQKLRTFYCVGNNLTTLNVKNGRNARLRNFSALNNPDLTCIKVDHSWVANLGNGVYRDWLKDDTAMYGGPCTRNSGPTRGNPNSAREAKNVKELLGREIQIYPNPTKSILNIESNEAISAIEIYAINGRKVLDITYSKQLDVSSLIKGVYVIKFISDTQSTAKKLVIE